MLSPERFKCSSQGRDWDGWVRSLSEVNVDVRKALSGLGGFSRGDYDASDDACTDDFGEKWV